MYLMKKAVVLLLMMALLVGCGKTDVPNTEGNTQQSEIPSEEENIEEDSQSSEETEEAEKEQYTYTDLLFDREHNV